MSRSRRQSPFVGHTTATSDKPWKQQHSRKLRRAVHQTLSQTHDGDAVPRSNTRKGAPIGMGQRTASSGLKIPIPNTCANDERNPFRDTGRPEPLSGNLAGWWSRRINREHRLVHRVTGKGEAQPLEMALGRYHY